MNGTGGTEPPGGGGVPPEQPQSRQGDYSAPGLGAPTPPVPPAGPPQDSPPAETGGGQPPYQPPPVPPQPVPGAVVELTGPVAGPGAGMPPAAAVPPVAPVVVAQPKRRRGGAIFTAIVAGLIGALIVLLVMPAMFGVNPYDLVRGKIRKAVSNPQNNVSRQSTNVVSPTQGATDVTAIAKKVTPSVVNINVTTAPQTTNPFTLTTPQEGTGSGVIYTSDGYIITNNHVVSDAQDITVSLASGEELKGKKVGADPDNDIAVVKIDKTSLPPIEIGNSDNLVVGQLVVAVGSPLGFEQTVTAGIISALHRALGATSSNGQTTNILTDLIQTDAPINPGNSGGALCDGNARLIGINTLIASQSGGSVGIGFAIPINTAKQVADDLIAGRPVSHPYIGVLGQTVSQSIAQRYNLPVSQGAYVTRVVPGSPADKAGIKAGDIIVGIDGKPVKSMDDVIARVRTHGVGDKVSVTYYSGGSKKTTQLTLAEKPTTLPQQ